MTMNSKKIVERRKHRRFVVSERAFASLRPHSAILGQLLDISKDGLAFRYIAYNKQPYEALELDILLADNGFYLDRLPIKTISDLEIPKKSPFESIKMRRLSVQFGELTRDQVSQLERFIKDYIIGG